jgi:hypothetical protein
LFYFYSLDPPKNIPYTCVRKRLSSLYGKTLDEDDVAIIRPINIGLVAQSKNTTTCGLYCIYAAHVIYLAGADEEFRGDGGGDAWIDEDAVLQFAHEHFGDYTFVKRVLYL